MYQQSCCTCRRCLDTVCGGEFWSACNYCGGELHGIQCAQGNFRVSLHQTFRLRAEIFVYGQHAQITKPLVRLEQVEHTFFYSQSALFVSRIVHLQHKCCHAPWAPTGRAVLGLISDFRSVLADGFAVAYFRVRKSRRQVSAKRWKASPTPSSTVFLRTKDRQRR